MAKKTEKATHKPGELITRGEWLETVIKLSETAIEDGDGNGMAKQVENYSKELKEWRKNETKGEKITHGRHTSNKR